MDIVKQQQQEEGKGYSSMHVLTFDDAGDLLEHRKQQVSYTPDVK